MADVTVPSRQDCRDRGQLLLVTGFGLAVSLVVLALILNTAIFTENLATRGSDIIGGKDAAQFRAAAQSGGSNIVMYANYHNDTSYADLYDEVNRSVDGWSEAASIQQSVNAEVTSASVVERSNGTRIYQYEDRNFTDDDRDPNWTLVADTEGVRAFNFTVAGSSLANQTLGNITGTFYVEFDDGSTVRRVSLYGEAGSSDVVVSVTDGSGSELGRCVRPPGTDGDVNVSITRARFEGTDCEALQFFGALSGPFDIRYRNAKSDVLFASTEDTAVGQYDLVVNKSYGDVTPSSSPYDDASAPNKTYAVYSLVVNVTYHSPRLRYATNVRVAPGEQDD